MLIRHFVLFNSIYRSAVILGVDGHDLVPCGVQRGDLKLSLAFEDMNNSIILDQTRLQT